ncbi:MAG: site-specific integrase, partial [Pedococcus sp.]
MDTTSGVDQGAGTVVPGGWDQAVVAFERHLRSERGRSEHTVRAYLGDVRSLAGFLAEAGIEDLPEVALRDLRAWLATQAQAGAARATIARRSAAARTFLGWATRTGRIVLDPSLRLAAPKRAGHLPEVLRQSDATALLEVAAVASDDQDALHLRDRAALELLYASGIRVGELTALDLDDVDLERNVLRVMGKGGKERTVPFGIPARDALRAWLDLGRPQVVLAGSGHALLLGRRERPLR